MLEEDRQFVGRRLAICWEKTSDLLGEDWQFVERRLAVYRHHFYCRLKARLVLEMFAFYYGVSIRLIVN